MKEGTWKLGNKRAIQQIASEVNKLSRKAYNIVGDDEFMDGLDKAKNRAEELARQSKESLSKLNRLYEKVVLKEASDRTDKLDNEAQNMYGKYYDDLNSNQQKKVRKQVQNLGY